MFKLTIDTGNDFFEDRDGAVAYILRELADRLADQYGNGRGTADVYLLQDGNGNTVGRAAYTTTQTRTTRCGSLLTDSGQRCTRDITHNGSHAAKGGTR